VEHSAYSSRLVAVPDKEILICPSFKIAVEIGVMPITDCLQGGMEIPGVFLHHVMRCKIYPTAKPSNLFVQLKITDVHMDDGYMRVMRVKNDRNTCCEELLIRYAERLLDSVG